MYLCDLFTAPVCLAGLPSVSLPVGLTPERPDRRPLPVGLQLHADHSGEARLLAVAHRYQQATDWHLRAPPGVGRHG